MGRSREGVQACDYFLEHVKYVANIVMARLDCWHVNDVILAYIV